MRKSLTPNEDLKRELKEIVRQIDRFEVDAKACGFQPGIDLRKLNQLYDELEIADHATCEAKKSLGTT